MAETERIEDLRCTTVCIDSYRNGVPTGRFYNPAFPQGRQFHSITQFLAEMEQALELSEAPKAFQSLRRFIKPPPAAPERTPDTSLCTGAAATFVIRILFRQNASWQGSLTWQEGHQEQSFRSVLELILLMNSALQSEAAS